VGEGAVKGGGSETKFLEGDIRLLGGKKLREAKKNRQSGPGRTGFKGRERRDPEGSGLLKERGGIWGPHSEKDQGIVESSLRSD